jgi:hypothetical protein
MYKMCDVKKPIITLVLMMLSMLPWPLCGKRLSLGKHPNRAKGFAKQHAQTLNVHIIVDKIYTSRANILT